MQQRGEILFYSYNLFLGYNGKYSIHSRRKSIENYPTELAIWGGVLVCVDKWLILGFVFFLFRFSGRRSDPLLGVQSLVFIGCLFFLSPLSESLVKT